MEKAFISIAKFTLSAVQSLGLWEVLFYFQVEEGQSDVALDFHTALLGRAEVAVASFLPLDLVHCTQDGEAVN